MKYIEEDRKYFFLIRKPNVDKNKHIITSDEFNVRICKYNELTEYEKENIDMNEECFNNIPDFYN